MNLFIPSWLTYNWQRKLVALLAAIIIWIFVNQSIYVTKTLPGVPVRVVNVPADKTIDGMMPNGIINKRLTLTLSGTKNVVDSLEPSEVEVLIDAAQIPSEGGVQISKKNLVSLNPSIDLQNDVTQIDYPELVISLSRLMTAKIPITIRPPIGNPPIGYEFLGIWPQTLMQTVSGPEQQVAQLRNKGLELTLDLNEINQDDLDVLQGSQNGLYDDEISFRIPERWKKVMIPYCNYIMESINDPDAQQLHVDFLRKKWIPIATPIPISAFYPFKDSERINPKNYPLIIQNPIEIKNEIPILAIPLYSYDVSHLFLDIVRDHFEISVIASPQGEIEPLQWSVEFIDAAALEENYVNFLTKRHNVHALRESAALSRENHWRERFREYLVKFSLYKAPHQKLKLKSRMGEKGILVEEDK